MNSPKISIIVPVYKAESYIKRCIDSILSQTFTDFEVLLIDDGSPDKSGEICDEYAQKDNRVRVFHKENGGVSSARNVGIDNAFGEYTIHADPDDWVEPNILEELYKKALEEDADMTICDFYLESINYKIKSSQNPQSQCSNDVLRQLMQQKIHGSCWNKLVKIQCIKKCNIRFSEGFNLWEDLLFNCKLLMSSIKVSYLPQALYHYTQGDNSNSLRNVSKYSIECIIYTITSIESIININNYRYEIFKLKERCLDYVFLYAGCQGIMETYKEIHKEYIERNSLYFKNPTRSAIYLCLKGYPSKFVDIYFHIANQLNAKLSYVKRNVLNIKS